MKKWYVCVVTNDILSHLYPVITRDPHQLIYDIKHIINPLIIIPSSMQNIVFISEHDSDLNAQRELSMFQHQTHLQKIQYISHYNPGFEHILH